MYTYEKAIEIAKFFGGTIILSGFILLDCFTIGYLYDPNVNICHNYSDNSDMKDCALGVSILTASVPAIYYVAKLTFQLGSSMDGTYHSLPGSDVEMS